MKCKYCYGNDQDMPCAYPGELKPGCLRDSRLKAEMYEKFKNNIPENIRRTDDFMDERSAL
jgi:hypothetical protein